MIPIADGMPRDMRIIFGRPEELSISQFGKVANVQDRQVDLLRLLQTLICPLLVDENSLGQPDKKSIRAAQKG